MNKRTFFAKIENVKLAGSSFRQEQLWALKKAEKAFLTLRREPNNEYDKNAIQVLAHAVSKNGKASVYLVGYIPKNIAVWLAKHMDMGLITRVCNYRIVGGYDKKALGLRFDVIHQMIVYEQPADLEVIKC